MPQDERSSSQVSATSRRPATCRLTSRQPPRLSKKVIARVAAPPAALELAAKP